MSFGSYISLYSGVFGKFDEKEFLTELDCVLNYCENHHVSDSTITDIIVKTLHYIKTCKNQRTPGYVEKTNNF